MRRRLALTALLALACASDPAPGPSDGDCVHYYGLWPICRQPEGRWCIPPQPERGKPCWECLERPPPPPE